MGRSNLLIVGDSERNADLLYAVRTLVRDPFIWFTRKDQPYLVARDLDLERLRTEARHCRSLPYSRFERRLRKTPDQGPVGLGEVLRLVLRDYRIRKVTVAENFPLGLSRVLRQGGIKVKLSDGPLFPDRAWKTADEVKKISAAVVMAEVGLAEGLNALRRAKPGKGRRLMVQHAPMTSERLRAIIDTAVLQAGGTPHHTVVSCGPQSSDPQERGHGPLLANQPIVIGILPRSQCTGYYGDITRTVVRGRASEFLRGMFDAVLEAHSHALRAVRHDTPSAEIHRTAESVFRARGFRTSRRHGKLAGFFHPLGHGIGLDSHESPRLSPRSRDTLRAGHVIALEPGLYYTPEGGVRVEDVVHVTRTRAQNLTKAEKQLEI